MKNIMVISLSLLLCNLSANTSDNRVRRCAEMPCQNLYDYIHHKRINERPIVIISLGRNNKDFYIPNLHSLINQHYDNYKVYSVDDASTDGTPELVEKFLGLYDTKKRVTFIKNTEHKGALHNLYTITHQCADDAIIVVVDGDDMLAHASVLEIINDAYQNPNVWLTYGSFKPLRSSTWNPGFWQEIPISIVQTNTFRSYRWQSSHLRTYYAWLFKKINKEDLQFNGTFYPASIDAATMFPMLEMAGKHSKYLADILYIYNDNREHNVMRTEGENLTTYYNDIIKKTRYQPLAA